MIMKGFVQANLHHLQQAAELVEELENTFYARSEPAFYHSSVGGHLRHCIEHYESFMAGISEGKIDYDARMRDSQVECDTKIASERILNITKALGKLIDMSPAMAVRVKVECAPNDQKDEAYKEDAEIEVWQSSSVGRELQFLASHTVHHFAMIRSICRIAGKNLNPDFGVAPSTLRYHRELSAADSP